MDTLTNVNLVSMLWHNMSAVANTMLVVPAATDAALDSNRRNGDQDVVLTNSSVNLATVTDTVQSASTTRVWMK